MPKTELTSLEELSEEVTGLALAGLETVDLDLCFFLSDNTAIVVRGDIELFYDKSRRIISS